MTKPDPTIFEHAIRTVGVPAERILFLDDVDEHVDAARRSGLRAVRVRGVQEVRTALRSEFPADSPAGLALRPSAS